MFLAGLKFALGLVVGLTLISGVAMLGLIGAELFGRWRKRRQRRLYEARSRALLHVMPQIREHAVFCFRFRTDDWIRVRDKSEHLR
jgi:hypothetical protein